MNLKLEPYDDSALGFIVEMMSDEIYSYELDPKNQWDVKHISRMFTADDILAWVIFDSDNGNPLGYCAIYDMDDDPWSCRVGIARAYRNRGIARQAARVFLDTVGRLYDRWDFIAEVNYDDLAGIKLLQGYGAEPLQIDPGKFQMGEEMFKRLCEQHPGCIEENLWEMAELFGVERWEVLGHTLLFTIHNA